MNRLQGIVELGSDKWYLKEIEEAYADPKRKGYQYVKNKACIPHVYLTEPERCTYTVEDEEDPLEDGPSFLKAIIDHTYANTLSNTAVARENLSSLSEYMKTL